VLTERSDVKVGRNPSAIAVNPNTNKIYVTNQGSNTVSVINGTNDKVLLTNIKVGQSPVAIAVNPNTDKIYVGTLPAEGIALAPSKVYVIDGNLPPTLFYAVLHAIIPRHSSSLSLSLSSRIISSSWSSL
jgi:YVTN family beta-propeller protein